MSTLERPDPRVSPPPLEPGQRLDQPTFHARYEAMPPSTRAELIGGVVHILSRVRADHGETTSNVAGWLGWYRRSTRGVRGGSRTTTILSDLAELQSDCIFYIPQALGGLSRVNADGYRTGPPELVIDVAGSSREVDLGEKKKDYQSAGVPEYVVVELDPDRVHWFVLHERRYIDHPAGADGIFRSQGFPGLWLDAGALFAGDLDRLIAALERGLATPEHAVFAARLAAADHAR